MTEETKTMYYGAHEIVNVEDEPNGFKRVEVKFASPQPTEVEGAEDLGEKFSLTKWELEVCASTEACSEQEHHTFIMARRNIHVVGLLLDVMEKIDMRVEDFTPVIQRLLESNQIKEEKARLKAFGVSEASEIRHSHWDKMLQS